MPATRSYTSFFARGWSLAGLAFCLLMLGVHIAAALNSGGVADFWRDMYWATSIAHGERFPLAGPQIYQLFELGPWWFYLLAVPMWLTGSVAATCAFVQMLAAAKYFLAWRLGTRLADARLGFAFAASLAVAGWSTVPILFPSHIALVETTLLLLAAVTWRCRPEFSLRNAILLGLASAACLHAHPTTLGYVVAAGIFVLWEHRSRAAFGWMCLAGAIAVASLLPPWFDHGVAVAGALKPLPAYLDTDLGVHQWWRTDQLVYSVATGGAWVGLLLMTTWKAGVARFAWWVFCGCLAVAAVGVTRLRRRDPRLFRLAQWALACFVAQCALLVFLRPVTPMWMVPSCLPPLALAIAIGWYAWLREARLALRVAGGAVMAVYVALSLVPFSFALRDLRAMRVMPGVNPFFDVITRSGRYVNVAVPFYPVRQIDRLAGYLCGPAVLHARLAAVIEATFAAPIRNACGHWPELHYGGTQGQGPHIAGLFPYVARASGIVPTRIVADMAFYDRVRPIAPVAGGGSHPPRRLQIYPDSGSGPPAKSVFDFDTAAADVVVLTNRMPNAAPMSVDEVTVDGQPAKRLADDGSSSVYGCAACAVASKVHWHVQVNAIEANLDLVVLRAH